MNIDSGDSGLRECEYPGSCISNECGGSTTTRNHIIFNKTSTTAMLPF
jgi:hypothetical protein